MNRPPKSSSTACNKLEAYCDFLESVIATGEATNKSMGDKISDLSMELVNTKLKLKDSYPKPCKNFIPFKHLCPHCQKPVCKFCGACTNKDCRLFNCTGDE